MMKSLLIFPVVLWLSACVLLPDPFSVGFTAHTDIEKGLNSFNAADYPRALEYLSEPAQNGDMDAQYIVGMTYLYGLAGVKNSYAAQKWLTLAAQSGQRAAQEQLAFFYQNELTPLYNPIDSYYWFSVIIGDHPEYREKMQNMEWTLRSRGLLATAQSMPKPIEKRYKGIDYNSLFPLR